MTSAGVSAALPMLLLAAAALAAVTGPVARPWLVQRRHARLRAKPFPATWRQILRRRVPLVARLPAELQLRLKGHIQVFIAEKPFIGCRGQRITDEVRVTIAAQACLLLLGHQRPDCYPRLRQILVYPDAFVADRERSVGAGLVQAQRHALAGESWTQGQVILSWADVVAGSADMSDGRNVALHEFAHQVDQDSGVADGRPWRPNPAKRRRWAKVMDEALRRLQNEPSPLIGSYGASDPAEFFAVVTEVFFERPRELAVEAPAAYGELAELYQLNPTEW